MAKKEGEEKREAEPLPKAEGAAPKKSDGTAKKREGESSKKGEGADAKKLEKKLIKRLEEGIFSEMADMKKQLDSLSQMIAEVRQADKALEGMAEPRPQPKAPKAADAPLYRCEIVANRSVFEDIVEVLEAAVPDILYTLFPTVHGRGKRDRKEGNVTWPELNFVLVSYVDADALEGVKKAVGAVKKRFKKEGIKLFIAAGIAD